MHAMLLRKVQAERVDETHTLVISLNPGDAPGFFIDNRGEGVVYWFGNVLILTILHLSFF